MFNFTPAIPGRGDLDWCWYLRRHGMAGEVIERVLHDIGVMDPGGWAAWGRSTLTATGSPVEVLFSAGQTDLHLTTEVANPMSDPTSRVGHVCRIMRDLGGKLPPPGLRDVISAAQGTGPLQFGARLGLRHNADGLQCQLIAELPSAAADLSGLMCSDDTCPSPGDLGENTRATMVGFDGTTGHVTIFYEMQQADQRDLARLADQAGVCADDLALSIDSITNTDTSATLPKQTLGVSYAMQGENKPPILTLHLAAAEIFRSDADTSRQIKTLGGHFLTGYAAFVDNLPPTASDQRHHGKIGFTMHPGTAPQMSIGVAAPWDNLFDET